MTSTTTTTSTSTSTTGDTTAGETDTTGGGSLDEVLTLQHVQVKGTHNSYHVEPLLPFDPSHEYSHAPLDVQLGEQGVRAFELDVHKGVSEFEVYHITVIDASATCTNVPDCLGLIRDWSLAHPDHLPIVVWVEIKDSTGGLPIGASDLDALDDAIREVLPPEQLFTPDDLQAGHPSVRAALEAEGWPTLAQLRGQILLVLLNVEEGHADDYTAGYTSLAGRAMFARATPGQFSAPWAALAKLGIDDDEAIAQAHAANLLIATNVCGAGEDDAACEAKAEAAKAAGIHMLKDDFPAPVDGMRYFLDFPDGNPARCNPVTAPPACTSEALEDL
ncbi:phosphatidylinositol-specific phospholipase C domain-containing protein [Nannocystis exedens]|uniref:phosphatidylinositol-specific phospholipase C domain-containing protein n=1 Tax=Nannocystis exedens TaxID=54 RepID=UPI00147342E8|nr:phosphatidylinositol-specific phospholipase C domain-containing protein [Nannocystis exedens]